MFGVCNIYRYKSGHTWNRGCEMVRFGRDRAHTQKWTSGQDNNTERKNYSTPVDTILLYKQVKVVAV